MAYQLKKGLLLVLLILTGCAAQTEAPEHSYLLDRLPRAYHGSFRWHGASALQKVSIAIDKVSYDSEKGVTAKGTGKYVTMFREADIEIEIAIAPDTMRFEMWEKSLKANSDFITDGSHVGEISKDLKTITAVWTSRESGRQGDLKLEAE